MTNQQNIANIQQKFIIQIDSKTLQHIKPFDRNELVKSYMQLFSGFAWVNWTNKFSLGRAWQTALTQCGAFCNSKTDKNPAAKYLKSTYRAHKKYWSQIIMTHKNRENTLNPNDTRIKQLREHGKRMIREAIDKINLILARYNEYTLDISRDTTATMATTSIKHSHQQQTNTAPSPERTDTIQPATQKLPEPQRIPQPIVQPAQKAIVAKQLQQQTIPQPIVQPAQKAIVAKQPQQQTIPQPVVQKRPYEKSAISVHKNTLPELNKTASLNKTTTFTAAQMRIVTNNLQNRTLVQRQINIFALRNFNQRAA